MSGINKVILVGHLGKDPDLRIIEDNVAMATFPLATCDYLTKNGVRTEQTEWHNVVMWRGMAESAAKILTKGNLIYLEGKARTHSFKDEFGVKRYTTEIVVDTFKLVGKNNEIVKTPVNAVNAQTD